MAELGKVIVKVGADISELKSKLDTAGKDTSGATKLISGRFVAMGAAIAAAAAVAASAISKMALAEFEAVDATMKLANSIGATITGMRSLDLAAGMAGLDNISGSMTKLNQELGAFELGTGRAAKSIEALGLNVQAMRSMDADQKVAYIADQIQAMGVSAQEASFHLRKLGFDQASAAGVFMQGGDAFRQAREDVERFGLAVSQLDGSKMEAINDNISVLGAAMDGLKTRISTALAPAFLEVTDAAAEAARGFFDAYNEVSEFDKASQDASGSVLDLADDGRTMLTPVLEGLVRLAGLAADSFRVMGSIIGAIVKSAMGGISAINGLLQSANQAGAWVDKKLGLTTEAQYQSIAASAQRARDGAVAAANDTREAWGRVLDVGGEGKYQKAAEKIVEAMAGGRGKRAAMKGGAPSAQGGAMRGGDDAAAKDAKAAADKAAQEAKRAEDEAKRALENVQKFLASKRELENADYEERLAALTKAQEMKLISQEQYNMAVFGVKAKHAEAVAAFDEQDLQKEQEKLDKKHEIGLLSDAEYYAQKIELEQQNEEAKQAREDERYQNELDRLQEQRDNSIVSQEEYDMLIQDAALSHEDALTMIAAEGAHAREALRKKSADNEVSMMQLLQDTLQNIAAAGSRAAFNMHKAVAIANALISAREAVVNAFNDGARTSVIKGVAMAAFAASKTAAQIASIKSTTFGGGGGGVSAGGGGGGGAAAGGEENPQAQAEAAPAAKQTVTISLQGEVFGAKQVRDLIEKINDATKNGAILNMV